MKQYEKVPYPRPDFLDDDLITKEMVNGTFAKGMIEDVKHFRPVLDRYNVTQDKLTDRSVLKGSMSPQAYDITLSDPTLSGIQENAWQPHYVEHEPNDPEIVYNPLDHYSFVEYKPYSTTDLPIPLIDDVRLDIPYYDRDNAGLFGFKEIKYQDGNITERYAAFCSLKDYSITILGKVPASVVFDSRTYVGYVKGALVMHFEPDMYVSFTLDGSVYTLTGMPSRFVNFGDHGCFAAEGSTHTFVYNTKLEAQDVVTKDSDGNPVVSKSIDGLYCQNNVTAASSYTQFPFGIELNGNFYFAKTEGSSNKWWLSSLGWRVEVVNKPIWKYQKKLKYDYATDNWLYTPLKTMKYNMIKHGVFVSNKLPCSKDSGDECYFKSSDPYGDFVTSGGKMWHTYDFKRWEEVTGDAPNKFYGMWGRIWVKGRSDNISGFMPYIFAITDVKDPATGNKKMVAKFDGFIFRGGA